MLSKLMAAALAASFFITLGGCAQVDTRPADDTPAATTAAEPAEPAPEVQSAAVTPEAEPQVAIPNPAVIEFAPESTELDSDAQALVNRLFARAKRAEKIVLKGYSDRRVNGNAVQVAISRAVQIRNELVKNGVDAKNVRIRYNTEQAKNMVTVDLGEQPLRVENKATDKSRN
jgi:outer membrane protein OmpA-like peptidoglycan-associated protein